MGLGNPPKPLGWWPCCAKQGSKWLKFESLVARHLESVFGRSCSTPRRAKLMSGRKCCCTWPVVLNWSRRASDRPWSAVLVLWPTGLCHPRSRTKVPLAGWTKRRFVMPPGLRVVKSHLIWWRSSMWMSQPRRDAWVFCEIEWKHEVRRTTPRSAVGTTNRQNQSQRPTC